MSPPPDSLSALLRRADPAAQSAPPSPATFAAAVHARIRAAEPPPARGFSTALGRQLLPLAAALSVLASIGAGSAVAYARERDARSETLATAYARSIDPWRMHGPSAPATHVHP